MPDLTRTVNCPECNEGFLEYKRYKLRCPYCEGKGKITFINFLSTPMSFIDRFVYYVHIKLVDPSEHVLFKWWLTQLFMHSSKSNMSQLIHQAYKELNHVKGRN